MSRRVFFKDNEAQGFSAYGLLLDTLFRQLKAMGIPGYFPYEYHEDMSCDYAELVSFFGEEFGRIAEQEDDASNLSILSKHVSLRGILLDRYRKDIERYIAARNSLSIGHLKKVEEEHEPSWGELLDSAVEEDKAGEVEEKDNGREHQDNEENQGVLNSALVNSFLAAVQGAHAVDDSTAPEYVEEDDEEPVGGYYEDEGPSVLPEDEDEEDDEEEEGYSELPADEDEEDPSVLPEDDDEEDPSVLPEDDEDDEDEDTDEEDSSVLPDDEDDGYSSELPEDEEDDGYSSDLPADDDDDEYSSELPADEDENEDDDEYSSELPADEDEDDDDDDEADSSVLPEDDEDEGYSSELPEDEDDDEYSSELPDDDEDDGYSSELPADEDDDEDEDYSSELPEDDDEDEGYSSELPEDDYDEDSGVLPDDDDEGYSSSSKPAPQSKPYISPMMSYSAPVSPMVVRPGYVRGIPGRETQEAVLDMMNKLANNIKGWFSRL